MLRRAVDSKLWAPALISTVIASGALAQAPASPPPTSFTPPAGAPSAPATTPVPGQAPAAPAPATPPPAAATPAAEPTPEANEAARAAYARGQAAFAQGRFDAARIAFEEAFAAVPNPIVLLSVSESRAKLGQIKEAIEALQRYLALRPDAPDRPQVEQKIAELAATPASVAVTSVPPGAELSVDGAPSTQRAPARLELSPGQHTLEYSLPGYKTRSELLIVEPGARYELEIVLQSAPPEAPPPPPAAEPVAPPPTAASESPTAALWITGGIGAAGIITGTVLGFLALKEQSDFESNPTEAGADRGERLALFADVGFGVGIMALATTAVLLFTDGASTSAGSEGASRPKNQARLELIPKLTPSTASATARVRF